MKDADIIIPNHLIIHILKYVKAIELVKLRAVHFEWKILIENQLTIWRKLISSVPEIVRWKYELISLKYPSMNSDDYQNLSDDQCRELFWCFQRWRNITKSTFSEHTFKLEKLTPNDKVDDLTIVLTDYWANYLAVTLTDKGRIYLYDINTGKPLINSILLSHLFDNNSEGFRSTIVSDLKIWRLEENRLALLLLANSHIFIWDVAQEVRITTPPMTTEFQESSHSKMHFYRGFDNAVYLMFIDESQLYMNFVKLEWDTDAQNIIERLVLVIRLPVDSRDRPTDIESVYIKDKSVMILVRLESNDIKLIQVDLSYNPDETIEINLSDQKFAHTIFQRGKELDTFYIPTAKAIVNKTFHISVFRAAMKVKLPSNKRAVFHKKEYKVNWRPLGYAYARVFLNNLFVITKKGKLVIYKLPGLRAILTLNFFRKPTLELNLSAPLEVDNIFFTIKNNKPCIIISTMSNDIIFVYFH